MELERIEAAGDPRAVAERLRALVPHPQSVSEAVAEIIAQVRAHGDAAVRDYTRRFDTAGAEPPTQVISHDELAAGAAADPHVRSGLERAIENVRRVAEAGLRDDRTVELGRHRVIRRERPVHRAAVYVPGGRAPYPSTVVMGVVTARVAGVSEVVVCSPPRADGRLDPAILAACELAGASSILKMGGAQAIAALAFGTETVEAVDVIVGPGNLYVQEAKRQVSGQVGIDGFAGPTDLMVIASAGADPRLVAADMLAQAEHGPGSLVVAVGTEPSMLGDVIAIAAGAQAGEALGAIVTVGDYEYALALAEEFAPEHLELIGDEAEALAERVTRAGCLFVGPAAGSAFGDYIAGSNHVLPTGGAARFASGLSTAHFRRSYCEVRLDQAAAELARIAAPVARSEGFELHARSMEARIRDNPRG